MDITITLSDIAVKGLAHVAVVRGHQDVSALCHAVLVELAGQGLRASELQTDSTLLAKVKAAPKEIRDAVDAIALPVDEKPAEDIIL